MNRLFDKSIVLACCIAAAMGLAVDARLVAAFCLGVIATSLAEVAQGNRARRASEAASYVYIIAAVFVPPFVPFAPLVLYDIARRVRREHAWVALGIGSVFAFALVADLRTDALTARTLLLAAILSVAATLLSLRTAQLEREQLRMRRTRDELQERALALEARNRDLADRQDYEVELATLAERARIAREIHDNVGHQLTRASLQAEALRVVHADEPGVAADFADVKRTVDEALQLVRASVHALNDNRAARGMLQTIDAAKHRRLARARSAHDADEFATVDGKADVVERTGHVAQRSIYLFEMRDLQYRGRHVRGLHTESFLAISLRHL